MLRLGHSQETIDLTLHPMIAWFDQQLRPEGKVRFRAGTHVRNQAPGMPAEGGCVVQEHACAGSDPSICCRLAGSRPLLSG